MDSEDIKKQVESLGGEFRKMWEKKHGDGWKAEEMDLLWKLPIQWGEVNKWEEAGSFSFGWDGQVRAFLVRSEALINGDEDGDYSVLTFDSAVAFGLKFLGENSLKRVKPKFIEAWKETVYRLAEAMQHIWNESTNPEDVLLTKEGMIPNKTWIRFVRFMEKKYPVVTDELKLANGKNVSADFREIPKDNRGVYSSNPDEQDVRKKLQEFYINGKHFRNCLFYEPRLNRQQMDSDHAHSTDEIGCSSLIDKKLKTTSPIEFIVCGKCMDREFIGNDKKGFLESVEVISSDDSRSDSKNKGKSFSVAFGFFGGYYVRVIPAIAMVEIVAETEEEFEQLKQDQMKGEFSENKLQTNYSTHWIRNSENEIVGVTGERDT